MTIGQCEKTVAPVAQVEIWPLSRVVEFEQVNL